MKDGQLTVQVNRGAPGWAAMVSVAEKKPEKKKMKINNTEQLSIMARYEKYREESKKIQLPTQASNNRLMRQCQKCGILFLSCHTCSAK